MVSFQKKAGFTLLELLIVIVIIGSYAIFNSPAHKHYLMRTKRSDAKQALVEMWYEQQAYQKACGRYADAIGTRQSCASNSTQHGTHTLTGSPLSNKGYYTIQIVSGTADNYILQAIPVKEKMQAKDTQCAKLTLDAMGQKRSYDNYMQPTTECWRSKSS